MRDFICLLDLVLMLSADDRHSLDNGMGIVLIIISVFPPPRRSDRHFVLVVLRDVDI